MLTVCESRLETESTYAVARSQEAVYDAAVHEALAEPVVDLDYLCGSVRPPWRPLGCLPGFLAMDVSTTYSERHHSPQMSSVMDKQHLDTPLQIMLP